MLMLLELYVISVISIFVGFGVPLLIVLTFVKFIFGLTEEDLKDVTKD